MSELAGVAQLAEDPGGRADGAGLAAEGRRHQAGMLEGSAQGAAAQLGLNDAEEAGHTLDDAATQHDHGRVEAVDEGSGAGAERLARFLDDGEGERIAVVGSERDRGRDDIGVLAADDGAAVAPGRWLSVWSRR